MGPLNIDARDYLRETILLEFTKCMGMCARISMMETLCAQIYI